jgi:predicted nucleic acid-binding protein
LIAPDSSVLIAALDPDHEAHERSRAALAGKSPRLVAHVAFETVSVFTRLPEGLRVPPATVLAALERDFPEPWLALSAAGQRSCLKLACAAGVQGGALYDALIAATAAKHGATLISADRRALPAYEAMGAGVVLIGE